MNEIIKEETIIQCDSLILNDKNYGKGYCIREGIKVAKGDVIIIQDADLEYDPSDYIKLISPIKNDIADVVYGSRFIGSDEKRVLFYWHSVGNFILTHFSNMFTNLNLSDMENCYKVFKKDIIKSISLKENRFGFEPEITAKISKIENIRIYEVGVKYHGRTYADGKKINWKDGISALRCIIYYNLFSKN
jgi:glycosyltransferase involved in cell wall biosynthesis